MKLALKWLREYHLVVLVGLFESTRLLSMDSSLAGASPALLGVQVFAAGSVVTLLVHDRLIGKK